MMSDVRATGLKSLGPHRLDVFGTGTKQDVFHSTGTLSLHQALVEDVLHDATKLGGTGLQDPGPDTIRTCSSALVSLCNVCLQLASCHCHSGGCRWLVRGEYIVVLEMDLV